eukprot:5607426-Prymnesium_polylepis.1
MLSDSDACSECQNSSTARAIWPEALSKCSAVVTSRQPPKSSASALSCTPRLACRYEMPRIRQAARPWRLSKRLRGSSCASPAAIALRATSVRRPRPCTPPPRIL